MAEVRTDLERPVVPAGARVVLLVSRGPDPQRRAHVAVPDVVGMAQGTALERLQAAGFQARIFNDYSDSFGRGRVMGQVPSAGANAALGDDVALLISAGRSANQRTGVVLPDVVGMSEAEAIAGLQAAGLSPQITHIYSPSVPAGVVIDQLPNAVWVSTARTRRPAWWLWLVLGLLALALLVLAFLLLGRRTTVPDVLGSSIQQAEQRIKDAGLRLGTVEQTQTAEVASGTVVAQEPDGGARVPRGSAVSVVVATDVPLVGVPSVRGLTQAEAVARLEGLGLRATTVTEEDAAERPGTVIAQEPLAGTGVARGSTVRLTVAQAVEPSEAQVPEVTGLTQPDAESTIEGAQLRVLVVENPSVTVAEGVVIAQLPAAGEAIAPGATIAIIVSIGGPEDATTVGTPDVVGERLPDAQATVAEAGLRSQPVVFEGSDEDPNVVVAQWPQPGEELPPDSTMVLLYAR